MKDSPDIEELLNGFIDGELTPREKTEVDRLIAHDEQIARQLAELQKCRMLVGSLPRAEAPAGMVEQIKTSLQKRTVVAEQPVRFDERVGARHLFFRKVIAAAAMIGLVAVLGAVVYTIVAPETDTEKPIVAQDFPQPVETGVLAKPGPPAPDTVEKSPRQPRLAAMKFSGRLELKASSFTEVNASINRALEDNGLLECLRSGTQADKGIYELSCGRGALKSLLADLQDVWARFDSATLFVDTGRFGEQIVVDTVSVEQITRTISQDSLEESLALAKDFAVLNSITEQVPGKDILAAVDGGRANLITVPKPVLTGRQEKIKKSAVAAEDKQKVQLTIVVVGGE